MTDPDAPVPDDPQTNAGTAGFASALSACLDADDRNVALAAFRPDIGGVGRLPRVPGRFRTEAPHPLAGLAAALVAGALNATGRPDEVYPFLVEVSDHFAPPHRYYVLGGNVSDLLATFPFLQVPLIRSAIALKDQDDAVAMVNDFAEAGKDSPEGSRWRPNDARVVALLAHPACAAYGPFGYDPGWALDRQQDILAFAAIDPREERLRDFEELFVENALRSGQPERALPLVEGRLPAHDAAVGASPDHFAFNGVCVLAALGRFDEALAAAREMVRQGYRTKWRFNLDAAARMPWTQRMRQNEWLGPLAATPAYQAFLHEDISRASAPEPTRMQAREPTGPLTALRDDAWGGKKPTRCHVTRAKIQPGDPIVRFRQLHSPPTGDGYDIASRAAFERPDWAAVRAAFEQDRVPVAALFRGSEAYGLTWNSAALDAFAYDVAKNPENLDVGRAMAVVAAHHPSPIRFAWRKPDDDSRRLAFEPLIDDEGHGKAVNVVWRLIKAGFREDVIRETGLLPAERADKAFAMLATFDDARLREAAAAHFGIPELPAIMTLAFHDRLTLDDHLTLADFGHAHPRYRAGLAEAMRAYALHIYSNSHPGVDWFLQGLEHYRLGHCSQLLYLLIHHPEDDDVFTAMLAKDWLPESVGSGGYDAYGNARPFYYRALLFNRALHAPAELGRWMNGDWFKAMCDRSQDRQARKLVTQFMARKG